MSRKSPERPDARSVRAGAGGRTVPTGDPVLDHGRHKSGVLPAAAETSTADTPSRDHDTLPPPVRSDVERDRRD